MSATSRGSTIERTPRGSGGNAMPSRMTSGSPAAEAALRRSTELNPHNSKAHHELGMLLMRVNRCDEAVPEAQQAVLENPHEAYWQSGLAEVHLYCRHYDQAIVEFEKTLPLQRDSASTYFNLGDAYFYQGRYERALDMYRRSREVPGWVDAARGNPAEAQRQLGVLKGLLARDERRTFLMWPLARMYTSLGDHDRAIAWLERAHAAHEGMIVYLGVTPHFDPLRGDPRFQALVKKVGLGG